MTRDQWLKDTFRNADGNGREKTSPRILLDDALRKFKRAGHGEEGTSSPPEPPPSEALEPAQG